MNNQHSTMQMLRRKAAARYLTERGIPIAAQTLAKYATTGGGPRFRKFGRFPLYQADHLDAWVDAKLGRVQRSTSDAVEVG